MGRATAGLLAAALLCAAAEASVIEVTSVSNVVGGAIDLGAGRTASGDTSSNAFLPFDEKLVRSLSLPQNGGMGVIHSTLQSTMTSSLLSADGVAESSLFMNEAVQNAGASAVALYSVEFTLQAEVELQVLASTWTLPSNPPGGGATLELIYAPRTPAEQTLVDLGNVGSADLQQVFPAGNYLLVAVAFARIEDDGPFPLHEAETGFSLSVEVVPAPSTAAPMMVIGLAALRRRRS